MIRGAEETFRDSGAMKESNMESNIVDTMHRYFTVSPGTERDHLENAIIDASKRYFEGNTTG